MFFDAEHFNPVRAFIYTGLCVVVVKFLCQVVQNNIRHSNLPQPPLSPVLGTIFGHLEHYFDNKHRNPMKFFAPYVYGNARQLQLQGEGLMRIKFGPFHNVILIINGKVAEKILGQRTLRKPTEYGLLEPLLGNGLVMINGHAWKAARKALMPAFNQANLNRVLPIMNEKSSVLASIINEQLDEQGQVVLSDLQPLMINLSIDLILATLMGINLHAQRIWADKNLKAEHGSRHKTPGEEYHHSLEKAFTIMMQRLVNPFFKFEFIFRLSPAGREFAKHVKVVREFTTKVILERKRQLEEDAANNNREDGFFESDNVVMPILDLMLKYNAENSSVFEVDNICDHVTTLIFGGHDTSATTSTYFFWRVGTLLDVQAKLHEEIDAVFHGDCDRDVTLDDIRQMPYLDACLKETLRLLPPIALYGREVDEDIQCGEHIIPKNATVIVLSGALLKDPLAYDEPNKFKPERHLESSYKFHHGAFIPFGSGPRVCIGFSYALQSLKILFIQVLRKYSIESLVAPSEMRFSYTVNAKISSPIKMRFQLRKKFSEVVKDV